MNHVRVAQLDRASDYGSEGHEFESCHVHHLRPHPISRMRPIFFERISQCRNSEPYGMLACQEGSLLRARQRK